MLAMGMPDVVADGEVFESDPPRKLVVTWRVAMEPSIAAEGFTRLTYEIVEGRDGVSRLSVSRLQRPHPDIPPWLPATSRGWCRAAGLESSATSSRRWRVELRCRRARAGNLGTTGREKRETHEGGYWKR